ncbi:MAG: penicillin-binding transpeptidase domain-containing protein [Chthoniobacterales bacterium]
MQIIALLAAAVMAFSPKAVESAFDGHPGALIILNATGETILRYNATGCDELLPPCSTFKIWNTAIGLETGIITDPDAPFWKWDGKKYWLDAWDHDQTVRSAFTLSCVPAYQSLARKIGAKRMAEYLHKISYGNEDISSGVDVFWLPTPGRKPVLISPMAQAKLIARLLQGELPFSAHTQAVLKDIMKAKETGRGILYGKTGTGTDESGKSNICWYVGYVESGGKTYPFACMIKGKDLTGKNARAVVEKTFSDVGLL